nr:argininosuccinate lyase [Planctomycetota bacterium]
LLSEAAPATIRGGLERLRAGHEAGEWTVEPGDEDVHSAVERRLIELIGEDGKRLHLGRSRNDQVATDLRLWLRAAAAESGAAIGALEEAVGELASRHRLLPLPGYTHLRRAMPSSVGDWAEAHAKALVDDRLALEQASHRWRQCPLGSGAGYGVPLELDRAFVAAELGFDGPELPVTAAQHSRGRAELAYLTALEGAALSLGKLAADLWLFSSEEFGFVALPVELTTGSSMMPQKRNPDLVELLRANARQIVAERSALLDVIRDLPSGYHRDFQLIKPPLFRGHDRAVAAFRIAARLVSRLRFDEARLTAAGADPALRATERALRKVAAGAAFRDAYREESRGQ